MAIGPVQLIALGFTHPDFKGEIIDEIERLRENDAVRVIDALAVYKDAQGEIEIEHLSNLTRDEAIEFGTKIGALIGFGIDGEEGARRGRRGGRRRGRGRQPGLLRRGRLGCARRDSQRLRCCPAADRAPLGDSGARCPLEGGRVSYQRRLHQPARSGRDRARLGRGGRAASCHRDRPTAFVAQSTTMRRSMMFGARRVARRTSRRVSRR